MRKEIIITIIIIVLIPVVALETAVLIAERENHPMASVVTEVDQETGLVICQDFSGNLWAFYGSDDWLVNDIAVLKFSKKEIVNAWKSGHMRERESTYGN